MASDAGRWRNEAERLRENLPMPPKRLLGLTVPVALELLLVAIDQCRHLMEYLPATTVKNTRLTGQRYRGYLSVREQKELDSAIESFYIDVKGRAEEEIERIGLTADADEIDLESTYPIAVEAVLAAAQVVFEKVNQAAMLEHFGKYADDFIKQEYILTRIRLGQADSMENVLGAALIPLIVARLEEFISGLVRAGMTLHPNALGELPGIPNEVFQRYSSSLSRTDIRRWQIDQKVKSFMDGPPNQWQSTILRWARIDVSELGADWESFIEMIQRRHAIIHNGGRVDAEYIQRVPGRLRFGLALGSSLVCNSSYVLPVLDELETWAMCLATRWTKHFFKEEGTYYSLTIERVIRLEELGRWTQALAILDSFILEPWPVDDPDLMITVRMNRWLCLQELGHDNDALRREISLVQTEYSRDENPEAQLHELGRLALLRDYPALVNEMRKATGGEDASLRKQRLREMPLFKRAMRESHQVRSVLLTAGRPSRGRTPPRSARGRRRPR
jgi:hypothetical protein